MFIRLIKKAFLPLIIFSFLYYIFSIYVNSFIVIFTNKLDYNSTSLKHYLTYFLLYFFLLILLIIFLKSNKNYLHRKFFENKKNFYAYALILVFLTFLLNQIIFLSDSLINLHLITHWVFSYLDFGFIKRGLPGSILYIFGDLRGNVHFILFISLCAYVLLLYLFIIFINKIAKNNKNLKISNFIFLVSPIFLFFLDDLGRFDQLNFILTISIILIFLNKNFKYSFFLLISFIILGILIHESFILFQLPVLISLFIYNFYLKKKILIDKKLFLEILSIVLIVGIFAFLIIKKGFIENYNIENIKLFLKNFINFVPASSPIETYYKNDEFITERVLAPLDSWKFNGYFNSFQTLIATLIFFAPTIFYLTILWSVVFSKANKIEIKIYFLIFSSTFVIYLVSFFLFTFIDFYRVYTGVIFMNILSINYIFFKNKKLNQHLSKINLSKYFNVSLIYGLVTGILLGPLERFYIIFATLVNQF